MKENKTGKKDAAANRDLTANQRADWLAPRLNPQGRMSSSCQAVNVIISL